MFQRHPAPPPQYTIATDLSELNRVMGESLKPLIDSMRGLQDKVERLSIDHVTRADFERLRADFQATVSNLEQRFPPREVMDGKFGALDQRLAQYAERIVLMDRRITEETKRIEVEHAEQIKAVRDDTADALKGLKDEVKDIRATIGASSKEFWTRLIVGLGGTWTALQVLQYLVQHMQTLPK